MVSENKRISDISIHSDIKKKQEKKISKAKTTFTGRSLYVGSPAKKKLQHGFGNP
jgi:hypothetical protein